MKLSVSDELTFHAYIIQAAALASVEHFYSQVGGKRAAMRLPTRYECTKARPPVGGGNIQLSWPNLFSTGVSDEL